MYVYVYVYDVYMMYMPRTFEGGRTATRHGKKQKKVERGPGKR